MKIYKIRGRNESQTFDWSSFTYWMQIRSLYIFFETT